MSDAPHLVPAVIWCPFPDHATARSSAKSLLDEGLVACANILPELLSIFAWQGSIDEAEEVGVLFKTNCARMEAAIARLDDLHPYEQPAIVGWRCDAAAEPTRTWLAGLGA